MKKEWEIKEHTKIKLKILEKYLWAWVRILGKNYRQLAYIDGFAGPGYLKDEKGGTVKGSPIIALSTIEEILKKEGNKKHHFLTFFVEKNKDSFELLKKSISGFQSNKNLHIQVLNQDFDSAFEKILSTFEKGGKTNKIPVFAFIDPFGGNGVSLQHVKRLMDMSHTEILLNLSIQAFSRGKSLEQKEKVFGRGFEGGKFTEEYMKSLHKIGVKYAVPFQMKNKKNSNIYDLIFATNNCKGIEIMKGIMSKVANDLGFTYVNFRSNSQGIMKELELVSLEKFVLSELKERKELSFKKLKEITLCQNNMLYSERSLKDVLSNFEKNNKIKVFPSPTRKRKRKTGKFQGEDRIKLL